MIFFKALYRLQNWVVKNVIWNRQHFVVQLAIPSFLRSNTRCWVYYFWNKKTQIKPSPSFTASRDRNQKQQDGTDALSLYLRGEAKSLSLEVSLQQLLACQVSKKLYIKSTLHWHTLNIVSMLFNHKCLIIFRAWCIGFALTLPIMYKIQMGTGYGLYGEGPAAQKLFEQQKAAAAKHH